MESKYWQMENFEEFDEQLDVQKKKTNKQNKRKWREIEAYKDRRKEQRELVSYNCFSIV